MWIVKTTLTGAMLASALIIWDWNNAIAQWPETSSKNEKISSTRDNIKSEAERALALEIANIKSWKSWEQFRKERNEDPENQIEARQ